MQDSDSSTTTILTTTTSSISSSSSSSSSTSDDTVAHDAAAISSSSSSPLPFFISKKQQHNHNQMDDDDDASSTNVSNDDINMIISQEECQMLIEQCSTFQDLYWQYYQLQQQQQQLNKNDDNNSNNNNKHYSHRYQDHYYLHDYSQKQHHRNLARSPMHASDYNASNNNINNNNNNNGALNAFADNNHNNNKHVEGDDYFSESVGSFADDATWILTSSFVILTMQSGFGLLEMGSAAPGNEVNIMMKNIFDVVFGGWAYFCLGYGISFGTPSIPFMGMGDFFPNGQHENEINDGLLFSSYLFQLSFAATSTTIVSGCVAMRMKFFVYCAFAFYAVIAYSFCAHWVWAKKGWLLNLGYHDFAGSGPVHFFGAVNGWIAILLLGPRYGRFDGRLRPASDFEESSPTSIILGLFMLWWGWIGFNCGSSFGITNDKWLMATRAGVNTITCTSGGGAIALAYTQIKTKGRFVLATDVANGILGSLVASSACCAAIRPVDACIVGAIGSLLANFTNDVMSKKFHLDDPVGAIGVHGASAIWGILAVGLFGDDTLAGVDIYPGLFRGGGFQQLQYQLIGILAFLAWSVATVLPFFYFVGILISRDWKNPRKGLRVPKEEEFCGADAYLHDATSEAAMAKKISDRLDHLQKEHDRLQHFQRQLEQSRRTLLSHPLNDDDDDLEGENGDNNNKDENIGDMGLDSSNNYDDNDDDDDNSDIFHNCYNAHYFHDAIEQYHHHHSNSPFVYRPHHQSDTRPKGNKNKKSRTRTIRSQPKQNNNQIRASAIMTDDVMTLPTSNNASAVPTACRTNATTNRTKRDDSTRRLPIRTPSTTTASNT